MSYSVTKIGGFGRPQLYREFLIDTIDDISSLPITGISQGSIAYCVEENSRYIFTNNKEWEILSGGGGSGSGLPDVTSADNGKVLTVVNGDWGVADAGGDTVCQILDTFSGNITWGEWSHGECTGVFVTNHQPSEDEWSAVEMTITINGASNDVYIGQSPVSLDNLPSGMTANCSKTTSDDYVAISILVSSVSEVTLSGSVDGDFYALNDKLGTLLGY